MSQIREAKLRMLGKLKEYELSIVSLHTAIAMGMEADKIEHYLRMLTINAAELKNATEEYASCWRQPEVLA